METVLKVENLLVTYQNFKLDNISFCCKSGEIVGLIGVNGAGKSTTIKAIMQIVPRQGGKVIWKGETVTPKKISEFREHAGYVGDNGCYYPNVKVKKILSFVSGLYRDWDYKLMEDYIDKFHLDTNKKMKELSTGMRVKLDLLIAMSHNAGIYILDEPTSGLDPVVREEVLRILHDLAKNHGKLVIISSHITSDLEKIADRAIYIVDGKIALDAGIEEIQKEFRTLEDVLFYLENL